MIDPNTLTCVASSEHSGGWECDKAIDSDANSGWATNGQGTGAWIRISFGSMVNVEMVQIKHRATGSQPLDEMFKDVELEFSDGTKVDFELNSIPFTQGLEWNNVILATPAMSTFVTITATSVYGAINNGFSDIRVFECKG